jgi:hypothetical protein
MNHPLQKKTENPNPNKQINTEHDRRQDHDARYHDYDLSIWDGTAEEPEEIQNKTDLVNIDKTKDQPKRHKPQEKRMKYKQDHIQTNSDNTTSGEDTHTSDEDLDNTQHSYAPPASEYENTNAKDYPNQQAHPDFDDWLQAEQNTEPNEHETEDENNPTQNHSQYKCHTCGNMPVLTASCLSHRLCPRCAGPSQIHLDNIPCALCTTHPPHINQKNNKTNTKTNKTITKTKEKPKHPGKNEDTGTRKHRRSRKELRERRRNKHRKVENGPTEQINNEPPPTKENREPKPKQTDKYRTRQKTGP